MKKLIVSLLLTGTLLVGSVAPAMAATETGEGGKKSSEDSLEEINLEDLEEVETSTEALNELEVGQEVKAKEVSAKIASNNIAATADDYVSESISLSKAVKGTLPSYTYRTFKYTVPSNNVGTFKITTKADLTINTVVSPYENAFSEYIYGESYGNPAQFLGNGSVQIRPEQKAVVYIHVINYGTEQGNFDVTLSKVKDDAGDTKATATSISKGKTYTKSFEDTYDTDYYKFTSSSNKSYYRIKLKNSSVKYGSNDYGVDLYLLDKNEIIKQSVRAVRVGKTLTADFPINSKGTYYLVARPSQDISKNGSYQTGKYSFSVTEYKDDAGDTVAKATSSSINKQYTKNIESIYDADYFKFKAKTTGKHTIKVKTTTLKKAYLGFGVKSGTKVVGDVKTINGKNKTTTITMNLKKGKTYYLGIYGLSGSTGKYTFAVYDKKTFKAPGKPTSVKASSAGHNSIKVSWKKVSGATKYQVFRATSKNGKYSKVGTTTSTSLVTKKATTGKKYYFKVKAVKTVFSNTATGSYSKVASGTAKIAKPTSLKTKVASKTSATISWKKVSGATKYEVYRATSKGGKYTKVKSTTKVTYTDKKLKTGKTYYYKVKAVKKSGKKTFTSAFSGVKSVTPKK